MRRIPKSPKVVADPIYGIIDIRPVLPMVETEEFQALGDKRQLGMAYLTFPSATHSRKAHSLGSYHATRELADRWLKRGFVNAAQADAMAGYALYHDIGHPAFSHVTEDLCIQPKGTAGMSMNSALSFKFIQELKSKVLACDIDFDLLEKFGANLSYDNWLTSELRCALVELGDPLGQGFHVAVENLVDPNFFGLVFHMILYRTRASFG